jgi:large subunit ribosomal protein L29
MKATSFKDLTINELILKEKELRQELFHLRRKNALKQLDDVRKIRHARKDIARVLTFLKQKKTKGETNES